MIEEQAGRLPKYQDKGKVPKKKLKKNLTSVSFAFTHTYTAVKTNSFRFFPQTYMIFFEKWAKTGNMGTLGGGVGVLTAPCDQDTTP